MITLEVITKYQLKGLRLVPCTEKRGHKGWNKLAETPLTDAEWDSWIRSGNLTGLGVLNGQVSGGLYCRDFDTMSSYEAWSSAHPNIAKKLATAKTHRGMHVYCWATDKLRTKKFNDGEFRGDGVYTMLPPSRHPKGTRYEWIRSLDNVDRMAVDPAEMGLTRAWDAAGTEGAEQAETVEGTEKSESYEVGRTGAAEKVENQEGLESLERLRQRVEELSEGKETSEYEESAEPSETGERQLGRRVKEGVEKGGGGLMVYGDRMTGSKSNGLTRREADEDDFEDFDPSVASQLSVEFTDGREFDIRKVEDAVAVAVPESPGRNHVALFILARALLALEQFQFQSGKPWNAKERESARTEAFGLWFERARPFLREGHTRLDYEQEFIDAVATAKFPLGQNIVEDCWVRAKSVAVDETAQMFKEDSKYVLFTLLCRELASLKENRVFFLSAGRLSELLKLPRNSAARMFKVLIRFGILKLAKSGGGYLANRYMYLRPIDSSGSVGKGGEVGS